MKNKEVDRRVTKFLNVNVNVNVNVISNKKENKKVDVDEVLNSNKIAFMNINHALQSQKKTNRFLNIIQNTNSKSRSRDKNSNKNVARDINNSTGGDLNSSADSPTIGKNNENKFYNTTATTTANEFPKSSSNGLSKGNINGKELLNWYNTTEHNSSHPPSSEIKKNKNNLFPNKDKNKNNSITTNNVINSDNENENENENEKEFFNSNNPNKASILQYLAEQEYHNEKLQMAKVLRIQEKSEELFNKKTFSSDVQKKEKLKKELDDIRSQKEMEECTFKPKVLLKKVTDKEKENQNFNISNYTITPNTEYDFNGNNQTQKTLPNNKNLKTNIFERLYASRDHSADKSLIYDKNKFYCTFRPQIGDTPNFEFKNANKDVTIKSNNQYYERINKARCISQEKINKTNLDYSTKYDERKKRSGFNASMNMNSYCVTDIDEYATFNPEKKKVKYNDEKQNLRKRLQNISFGGDA